MKKNISRNPLWPDWYNGKKIDEVQFGRAFLEQWPLKCVNGTLYTLDGPVEDELVLALVLHRAVPRVQRAVDAFQRPLFQKGAAKLDFIDLLAVVPVRP